MAHAVVKCERPVMNWNDFDRKRLFAYIASEGKNADCEIKVGNSANDSEMGFSSFRWLLSDISPVFERLIQAGLCTNGICEISIKDISPKDFDVILKYCHTKTLLQVEYQRLLPLYKAAMLYEIKPLASEILILIGEKSPVPDASIKWLDLFEVAYINKLGDKHMLSALEKITSKLSPAIMESSVQNNMEKLLKFDTDMMYDFVSFIASKISPRITFQAIEYYLQYHPLLFSTHDQEEDTSVSWNLRNDLIILLLDAIDFSSMSLEEYMQGPKKSKLLQDDMKLAISNKITPVTAAEDSNGHLSDNENELNNY